LNNLVMIANKRVLFNILTLIILSVIIIMNQSKKSVHGKK